MKVTIIVSVMLCLLLVGCVQETESVEIPQKPTKETVPTTSVYDYLPETMPDHIFDEELPSNTHDKAISTQDSTEAPSEMPTESAEEGYAEHGSGIELPDVNWN